MASEVLRQVTENYRFIWLGDGSLRELAMDYAWQLGIHQSVTFEGFIEETDSYYQSSDLYLHLASVEPMSNALIDALRHGLPTIASDAGGNSEAVLDGVNGYLVGLESPSFAASRITEVLSDSEKYSNFSSSAARIFEERFARTKMESTFLEYMNRVEEALD